MKKSIIVTVLCAACALSSCKTFNVTDIIDDPEAALSTIFLSNGAAVHTSGVVQSLVYKYLTKNPEAVETCIAVQQKFIEDAADKVLTPEEMKETLVVYLNTKEMKYRTGVVKALDVLFKGYQKAVETNGKEFSLEKYQSLVDAIILGIGDAVEMYTSEHPQENPA